jgi:uncharacterized protein (DUF2141 family)
MRIVLRFVLAATWLLLAFPGFSQATSSAESRDAGSCLLKINLSGVKVGQGNVVMEVYDSEKDFFKKRTAVQTHKASAQNLEFVFTLREGTYAVVVYQDVNENNQLDRRLIGMPKEPYGLSNNFQPKFGPPGFKDCKFMVGGETSLSISLR